MKRFDKGNEARRIARERIGRPPGTRRIEDKRRKSPKHRKPLKGGVMIGFWLCCIGIAILVSVMVVSSFFERKGSTR